MSGLEEESYLDRLLSSMEQQEENSAEDVVDEQVHNFDNESVADTTQDDMLSAFADAGMLLSPLDIPEIEPELFAEEELELDNNTEDEPSPMELLSMMSENDNSTEVREETKIESEPESEPMEEPDFTEPEMSESELQRLASMELDNLLEGVAMEAGSVEELFKDEILSEEIKDHNVAQATDDTKDDNVAQAIDDTKELSANAEAVDEEDEVESVVNEEMSVAAGVNSSQPESEQPKYEKSKVKKEKPKKEKVEKDKSKKGGIAAAIRNIFFVSEESTAESEEAKKKGKAAAKEAKLNDVKESDAALKETVLNESGEKELDENQKLIKEMYGKEQQDEVAPKQGFFEKLKYRLSLFMKKSAEEDALEDEAQAKEDEARKQAKAERQEANKLKKEEAKVEKDKKAEAAKAKKAAKKKEKKPKPEPKPGDILKIKPQSMILFILFVVGAIMLILMLNNTISYNRAISVAKASMENGNYARAYEAMSGLELTGNDVVMYEQASVIMYVERHYESYENYKLMGRPVDALDALITGLVRYEKYYMRACELGVDKQLVATREKILLEITDEYGISSTEALSLANLSITNYTQYYIKVEAYGKARQ